MERQNTSDVRVLNPPVIVWQVYVSFMSVLFVVIVVGNILTLLAVYTTEPLQTISNRFIVSLAVANLTIVYTLVFDTVRSVPQLHFSRVSEVFCYVSLTLSNVSTTMSLFNMTLVALERYIYIVYPFQYPHLITMRRANIIIASSWVCVFVFSGSRAWWKDGINSDDCEVNALGYFAYQMVLVVICVILISIMLFCYGTIANIARKQRKRIQNISWASKRVVSSSDLHLLKMMLSVVGFCMLCWIPIGCSSTVDMFIETTHGRQVSQYLVNLVYINSGVNVFIYASQDKRFRNAYKRLILGK